jgi:hypothetical protein
LINKYENKALSKKIPGKQKVPGRYVYPVAATVLLFKEEARLLPEKMDQLFKKERCRKKESGT